MTGKRTVVTEPSTRSPRDSWARPRSTMDCLVILERNDFKQAATTAGVTLVRDVGILALRVTLIHGKATLDTALRAQGAPLRWRPTRARIGTEPWQVTRDALELLATLDVDTPVRWG